jgi:acyl-CoA synthetase (AMP-forming)/AMP-acid ligase II
MIYASTFQSLLNEAAEKFAEKPFFIEDPALGQPSYVDLCRFAVGLEKQFNELDIPVGAPVATLLHNCGLAALLFLGTIAARRVVVPLNPLSTQHELHYVLDKSKCSAVIVDPSHANASLYGNRRAVFIRDHRKYFDERRDSGFRTDFREIDSASQRFAGEIVFTSGSTGRPKGVVLSESNLLTNARSLVEAYELKGSDRFLTICPLFHNSGQLLTTLACALVGGSTAAVKSDLGMLNFWSYFDKYRAQWTLGMNSFLALLLTKIESPEHPESIKGILTGGSAIDGSLIHRFETRFGVPVRTVYGLTETSSISTCEHRDPSPRSVGSSGRPLSSCQVRIGSSAEEPEPPAPRVPGEIWISGPHVFHGYVDDPQLTASRKRGAWFRTGDIGYFDENGNLFVVDRADSMLIVGGENVYPAEIERLVTLLLDAGQVSVTGVNHPIWGTELILVYTTLNDVAAPIAAWHRVFAEHLSAAKIPQRYVSLGDLGMGEFPKRPNGKLDKQALATSVADFLGREAGDSCGPI